MDALDTAVPTCIWPGCGRIGKTLCSRDRDRHRALGIRPGTVPVVEVARRWEERQQATPVEAPAVPVGRHETLTIATDIGGGRAVIMTDFMHHEGPTVILDTLDPVQVGPTPGVTLTATVQPGPECREAPLTVGWAVDGDSGAPLEVTADEAPATDRARDTITTDPDRAQDTKAEDEAGEIVTGTVDLESDKHMTVVELWRRLRDHFGLPAGSRAWAWYSKFLALVRKEQRYRETVHAASDVMDHHDPNNYTELPKRVEALVVAHKTVVGELALARAELQDARDEVRRLQRELDQARRTSVRLADELAGAREDHSAAEMVRMTAEANLRRVDNALAAHPRYDRMRRRDSAEFIVREALEGAQLTEQELERRYKDLVHARTHRTMALRGRPAPVMAAHAAAEDTWDE